jgi:hypothetical protein
VGVGEHGAEEDIWAYGEKITGDWRKLQNEEHHDLYCTQNVIWVIRK